MDLGQGSRLEERRDLNASRPVPSAIPLLPFFSPSHSFSFSFSLSCGFFLD